MKESLSLNLQSKTKEIVLIGLFIALSYIGAQIKFQGSIAMDSFPAFTAALIISPMAGAIIGSLGHLLTALTSGFPLSLPIHLVVAILMGITCYGFGFLKIKVNKSLAVCVAFILNGPISLWISALLMVALGQTPSAKVVVSMLIIPLSLSAAINIGVAVFLAPLLKKYVERV
jgi:uncharacterized membrane protein